MKKSTLFFSFLALTATAIAQPTISRFQPHFSKHVKAILSQGNKAQQKTTAEMERLSASATYTLDMTGGGMPTIEMTDSSRYKYSNGRGSTFDYSTLNFDEMDALANFDTSWKYQNDQGNIDMIGAKTAKYDNTNKRTSLTSLGIAMGTLENENEMQYEYNGAGKISIEHELYWMSGLAKWDTSMRKYYTYNTQGKLIEEKTYDGVGKEWEGRTTYHLNANGDPDTVLSEYYNSGTWELSSREIMTYYTNNKLKTSLSQQMGMTAWENQTWDSFGHTTGVDFATFIESREWDINTNEWMNVSQVTRVPKNNMPDQEIIKNWDADNDSWETQVEMQWSYNAKKNPVKLEMTSPLLPLPIPVMQVFMYYEKYFPVGIKDVANNTALKLYPNPATDKVMVQTTNGTSATFTIINMAGQVVLRSNRNITNGQVELSLAGMQPGNYQISVQFADGSVATQPLVKQ